MRDSNATDKIAREAARLLETGRAASIAEATGRAADALGLRGVPLPGPGRVRKHVQAMSMQALGAEGYAEHVHNVLAAAEELMTLIEETGRDVTTVLVGRGARGEIDGGVTLHVRLYGDVNEAELAETLVEHGYEEPAFETADTGRGRLPRLRLFDEVEIVLTLCPRDLEGSADVDLFTGNPIAALRLDALRHKLAENR